MKRKLRRLSGWWADNKTGGDADPEKQTPTKDSQDTKGDDKAPDNKDTQPSTQEAYWYWRRQAEKSGKELEKLQREADERKKAEMSETDKLKADKEAAEKKAVDALAAANQRAISSEARVQAVALGIKPERIQHAMRLADLSGVTVDENGEPDVVAIKSALEAVLKDLPELKTQPAQTSGGADFQNQHREGDKPLTDELIADMDAKELARRMPEIQAYYAKKKQK